MSIIQEKIRTGSLRLFHDYRSNSFNDFSSNTNKATTYAGSPKFSRGIKFSPGMALSVPNNVSFQDLPTQTVIFWGRHDTIGETNGRFIVKGPWYFFCQTNGRIQFLHGFSGTAGQWVTDANVPGFGEDFIYGLSYDNTNVVNDPTIYVDGVAVNVNESATPIGTATTSSNAMIIGNSSQGSPIRTLDGEMKAILIFDEILTATEHAQVVAELHNMEWPTKVISRKKDTRPDELADGDMEASGVGDWTAISSTLTKSTVNPREGNQALRITYGGAAGFANQGSIGTVGLMYRMTGWARGDGTAYPRVSNPAYTGHYWTGATSTNWQWFDFTFTADHLNVYLLTGVTAGYVEFDDVQLIDLSKTYTPTVLHTDWGANESTANVTSGMLENTPFEVLTGTHQIDIDTYNGHTIKVINPIVGGTLQLHYEDLADTNWSMYIDQGAGYVEVTAGIVASNVFTTTTNQPIILANRAGDYAITKYLGAI